MVSELEFGSSNQENHIDDISSYKLPKMSIEQVRSCKGYNNIDTNIIVPHLIKENHFYVGYNSAICIHGINPQPFLAQQVVVNKQMKPSIYGRIVNQYALFSMISDPDLTIDGWVENKEIDR